MPLVSSTTEVSKDLEVSLGLAKISPGSRPVQFPLLNYGENCRSAIKKFLKASIFPVFLFCTLIQT